MGKNILLKRSEIEPMRKRGKINQYTWRPDRYEQMSHLYGRKLDNKKGIHNRSE